jgi:hypothetical protein
MANRDALQSSFSGRPTNNAGPTIRSTLVQCGIRLRCIARQRGACSGTAGISLRTGKTAQGASSRFHRSRAAQPPAYTPHPAAPPCAWRVSLRRPALLLRWPSWRSPPHRPIRPRSTPQSPRQVLHLPRPRPKSLRQSGQESLARLRPCDRENAFSPTGSPAPLCPQALADGQSVSPTQCRNPDPRREATPVDQTSTQAPKYGDVVRVGRDHRKGSCPRT